jgi:hypothetical protein
MNNTKGLAIKKFKYKRALKKVFCKNDEMDIIF